MQCIRTYTHPLNSYPTLVQVEGGSDGVLECSFGHSFSSGHDSHALELVSYVRSTCVSGSVGYSFDGEKLKWTDYQACLMPEPMYQVSVYEGVTKVPIHLLF